MTALLQWRIYCRSSQTALPKAILTPSIKLGSASLAPEIAALLPNKSDPSDWVRYIQHSTEDREHLCAGIFLGSPLLQHRRVLQDLRNAGLTWVCNLPSICQHDEEFIAHLNEVGLGLKQELSALQSLGDHGFATIASVATAADATLALRMGFRTLFVLPKVRAYKSGFPSELNRNRAAAAVATEAENNAATLLGLIKSSETTATVVWPPQMQGVIEQPWPV